MTRPQTRRPEADMTPEEREDFDRELATWASTAPWGVVSVDGKFMRQLCGEIIALRVAPEAAPASLRNLLEDLRPEVLPDVLTRPVWLAKAKDDLRRRIDAALAALAAPVVSGWTSEPPKVPGWYWWRDDPNLRPAYMRVVQVVEWAGGGLAVSIPEKAEHRDGITTPELAGGEWQGPIEPK